MSSNAVRSYFAALTGQLAALAVDEEPAIERAADVCAEAVAAGHRIYLHDTGHLVEQELVWRTGGLLAFDRLTADGSAPDPGALRAGDVLVVGSVSGTGAALVELVRAARDLGVATIAVTAPAHSRRLAPGHPGGGRLMDAADIVLDNHAPYGDAALRLPGLATAICPASGIGAVALLWALTAAVTERLVSRGIQPSIYTSIHLPGGPAAVDAVQERYRELGY